MTAKEPTLCRCGQPIHGKADMLAGRLHTTIGCEILDPLDLDLVNVALHEGLALLAEIEDGGTLIGSETPCCPSCGCPPHHADCRLVATREKIRACAEKIRERCAGQPGPGEPA